MKFKHVGIKGYVQNWRDYRESFLYMIEDGQVWAWRWRVFALVITLPIVALGFRPV